MALPFLIYDPPLISDKTDHGLTLPLLYSLTVTIIKTTTLRRSIFR